MSLNGGKKAEIMCLCRLFFFSNSLCYMIEPKMDCPYKKVSVTEMKFMNHCS